MAVGGWVWGLKWGIEILAFYLLISKRNGREVILETARNMKQMPRGRSWILGLGR